MKKALVVSSKWGLNHGGAEEWAYYIKKKLEADGYACDKWAIKEDGFYSGFVKSIKANRMDVVIVMDWRLLALMPILVIISNLVKIKICCFAHGNEIYNINQYKKMLIKLIKSIGKINFIANSNNTKNLLEELSIKNIKIINPFANYVEKKKQEKNNLNEIIFTTISRLVERKNHLETILALDIYRKKNNKKIKYNIIGDGDFKQVILKYIKDNEFEFVEMHGRVSEDEKNKILLSSDYFLMISKVLPQKHEIEGFGMVYIEANSYGIPVLGGNLGGEKDSIEDGKTGITCGPHHTEIITALEQLVEIKWNKDYIRKSVIKYSWKNQINLL